MFKAKLSSSEKKVIQQLSQQYLNALGIRSVTNPASFEATLAFLKELRAIIENYKALMTPHFVAISKQAHKVNHARFSFTEHHAWKKLNNERYLLQEAINLIINPIKSAVIEAFAKEPRISCLSYESNFSCDTDSPLSVITFSDGSKIQLDLQSATSFNAAREKFDVKMSALANDVAPRMSM